MSQQILSTKLFIVRPQANLVAREHLLRKLDEIPHRKLTLVSASAGFGKTTAIASWIESHDLPAAWVSLDSGDNDPVRFFTYLLAALRTVDSSIGADIGDALNTPNVPELEQMLPPLINDLAAIGSEFLLVLDDYHNIENEKIHEALLFMLERAPATLHIVLTTRVDPPIPLGRLRVRGEVLEIRAADLRFSADEALAFLNGRMQLALSNEHLEALQAKTEGWVAGLQLAALSLQGRSDVEEFISAFTGADRYVLDYLLEEVMALLPPELQRMVLELSVLERFNGELCEAVTGSPGGADLLMELERRNLFLISLDNRREWYRYHHLFGDLLLHRLRQQRPHIVSELHCKASVWYAERAMPIQALSHARDSGDLELLGAITERFWREALNETGSIGLVELMTAITEPVIERSYYLRVLAVWGQLFTGATEGALDRLDALEAALAGSLDDPDLRELMGHVWLLRSAIVRDSVDSELAVAYGERAIEMLPDYPVGSPKHVWNASHSMITLILGSALSLAGQTERSLATFERVMQYGRDRIDVYTQSVALSNLCREYALVGCLSAALERADELELWASSHKVNMVDIVAVPNQVRARVLCERNEIGAAREAIAAAKMASSASRQSQWGELSRIQYLTEVAAGNIEAADSAVMAIEQMDPGGVFKRLQLLGAFLRADYNLRVGAIDAAVAWADAAIADRSGEVLKRTFILSAMEDLVLIRVLHRGGRSAEAIERLDTLRAAVEARAHMPSLIEAHVIHAEILYDRGDIDSAVESILAALKHGAAERFVGIFVRGGDTTARLLATLQRKGSTAAAGIPSSYLHSVADACGVAVGAAPPPPAPVRPSSDVAALTSREHEILQLMALGYSNRKIADKLYVSINTIKTHIANLFEKLGVRSRVEALLRAREEEML